MIGIADDLYMRAYRRYSAHEVLVETLTIGELMRTQIEKFTVGPVSRVSLAVADLQVDIANRLRPIPEHFPLHCTAYGVVCACGLPLDTTERCPIDQ